MIVTVAIRLALFPVFRAQVRSSRAMQELAPAMNDIKKKYGNDRQKLQQEQMKLYQERGINPVGGCLPMLVFFPVLFAMYAAFQQVGGLSGAHALTVEQLRDMVLWPFLRFTVSDLPADSAIDLTAHWLPWVTSLAQPDHLFFNFIGPLPVDPGTATEPAANRRPDPADDAVDDLLPAPDHDRLLQGSGGWSLHLLHHDDDLPDNPAVLRHGMGSTASLDSAAREDPDARGSDDAGTRTGGDRRG